MRSVEANIAVAIGTKRGYIDASVGDFPVVETIMARDYWVISFSGTIGGESYTTGDIIMARVNNANSYDEFFRVESEEPVPLNLYTHTGVAKAGYCITLANPSYNGPLFHLRVAGDTVGVDIYPDPDGLYDEGAIELYADGDPLLFEGWYDQSGDGRHVFETDEAKMPLFLKIDGIWRPVGTAGRKMFRNSFIGSQSQSTISILWQAPYTKPGGFNSFQPGISVGNDRTGAMSFVWTTGKAQHCYFTNQMWSDFEHNDGSAYVGSVQIDGNDVTPYYDGSVAGPAVAMTAPPYNELKLFANNDADGDISIFGAHFFGDIVHPQTVFNYYKAVLPSLWPHHDNLFVQSGDSITTSYFVDPYNSWPRKAMLDLGEERWRTIARGGWTIQDIIDNADRLEFIYDRFPHTNSCFTIFAGTNDLLTETVEAATGRMANAVTIVRNIGFEKVVGITCLARFHSTNMPDATSHAAHEAKRQPFNNWMRGASGGAVFDRVVNTDTIAIGAPTAPDNPTWFVADQVHLTPAGEDQLGEHVALTLDGIFL